MVIGYNFECTSKGVGREGNFSKVVVFSCNFECNNKVYTCPPNQNDVLRITGRVRPIFFQSGDMCHQIKQVVTFRGEGGCPQKSRCFQPPSGGKQVFSQKCPKYRVVSENKKKIWLIMAEKNKF